MPEISSPHKTSHQNGGEDEISVEGLSGALADAQTPSAHASSHQNGEADEISVAGLSGELADDQPVKSHGATKHDATVYDTIAKLTGAKFCRIKTGTYTGDGSTSQAIAGVGFQPKFLIIFNLYTVETLNTTYTFRKSDKHGGDLCLYEGGIDTLGNRIESLDSDGFTVNDNGQDFDPNANGKSYCYVAFG